MSFLYGDDKRRVFVDHAYIFCAGSTPGTRWAGSGVVIIIIIIISQHGRCPRSLVVVECRWRCTGAQQTVHWLNVQHVKPRVPTTGALVKCTSNYVLYKQPRWVTVILFPRLTRLTNASKTVHCASSQVNTCNIVPTTVLLGKHSLLGYITEQLTQRNTHDVARTV